MSTGGELERAAELIRAGRLVAFPTETVYGLGANALDAAAVQRIYEAKGRPPTSPLIVHVDTVEMARTVVAAWPPEADQLAHRFWPGPLTLVLPKQPHIPDCVTAGLPTVGVRIPAHRLALELIRAAGVPIAAPSANRYTELSPTTAEHVRAGLGDRVDLILDGGPTHVGIESTVLSLVAAPTLLRPGMVSRAEIEALIGPIAIAGGAVEKEAHPSPGMQERHYQPRTPLYIGRKPVGRSAYLWHSADLPAGLNVRMPAEPAAYAASLYDILHRLDREQLDFISVEPVPPAPEWDGIRDRLKRAAHRS